jgi:hypothetical protein
MSIREAFEQSIAAQAAPLRGLRVLLFGFSGAGFPGGDGAVEAADVLSRNGLSVVYTHRLDPDVDAKLAHDYDIALITNTRVGEILMAPPRLWRCAMVKALWFWDLRPGHVVAPLRGMVDRAYLTYNGPWTSPQGVAYAPEQWAEALGCPIGYAPQAAPLREPVRHPDGARVLFVGDLFNSTYHSNRKELCKALDVTVVNARDRAGRLKVESQLPTLYRSARYVLSTSPLAPGYTSVRTYSILACGGLMLLERFPGAGRLFREDEHVLGFGDAAEALESMRELDSDPVRRDEIAGAGRLLHASRHTVAHRVLSICSEVAGLSDGFAGFLE